MQGDFDKVLRQRDAAGATLLCICPNSPAIVKASIAAFSKAEAPLIFVATLNQVDMDGGYTGWTPQDLSDVVRDELLEDSTSIPAFLCLDHGGPWKKRAHVEHASHAECLNETRKSILACIDAGYTSLHLDATGVNAIHQTCDSREYRLDLTLELQQVAEEHTASKIYFEVGTDEDGHGDTATDELEWFARNYSDRVETLNLSPATFLVGDVGTTTKTAILNNTRVTELAAIATSIDARLKVHFADDSPNPNTFPENGAGAANIGPGLSATEYQTYRLATHKYLGEKTVALHNLDFAAAATLRESGLWETLMGKSASKEDHNSTWRFLSASRYVWNSDRLVSARQELIHELRNHVDVHDLVNVRLREYLDPYIHGFKLKGLAAAD